MNDAAKRLIAEALAAYGRGGGEDEEEEEEEEEEPEEEEGEKEEPETSGRRKRPAASSKTRFIEYSLRDVNTHIVCGLCAGYFIGATTISECLHTFCKSCIIKHFQVSKFCPKCNMMAHETNPLETLRHDRTMQSIVYKLVPHLQEEETKRYQAFMRKHHPELAAAEDDDAEEPRAKREKEAEQPMFVDTEGDRISLVISKEDADEEDARITDLEKPFIRTSSKATIHTLRKFLAAKLGLNGPDDLDVLCNGEVLGKEYTLEFVLRTRWRKDSQLRLSYRSKTDFQIP